MLFAERIKESREKNKLSQTELGEKIGVSLSTITRWEKGKRTPRSEELLALAKVLNVSVAYLLGETDSFAPFDNEEKADINKNAKATPLNLKDYLRVPVITMRTPACAGEGNGLDYVELEAEEWDFLGKKSIATYDDMRPPFGVYVEGDSMEEMDIPDGSVAYVNPAEEPQNGECALIVYRGQWSIKGVFINRDGSVTLRAGKPQYNLEIPADVAEDPMWFKIIGKVVEVKTSKKPKSFW